MIQESKKLILQEERCIDPLWQHNPAQYKKDFNRHFGITLVRAWAMHFGAAVMEAGYYDRIDEVTDGYIINGGTLDDYTVTKAPMIKEGTRPMGRINIKASTPRLYISAEAIISINHKALQAALNNLIKSAT